MILINVSSALAGDTVVLRKGEQAPFDGILFDQQKATETRNGLIERDGYKLINESLEKSLNLSKQSTDLSEKKVSILLEQNNKLAESLYEARQTSTLEHIAFFGLGIIATGIAVYGTRQITK